MTAVVDASVALKWQFEDEEATHAALDLLRDFVEGKIKLIAPTLLSYEIVSGINVAVSRKRISEASGYRAVLYLTSLQIELRNFGDLIESSFRLAREYSLSGYDCAYMALAEKEKCDFITGDKKLFNAVTNELVWVRWIGEYPFTN